MKDALRRQAAELSEGQRSVAVYCDLEALHPRKRPQTLVQVFVWRDQLWSGAIGTSIMNVNSYGGLSQMGGLEFIFLDGDTPTWKRQGPLPENAGDDAVRARWSLACDKCGRFPVQIRREHLHSLLKTIWDAGHDAITLQQLAAIVSSGRPPGARSD